MKLLAASLFLLLISFSVQAQQLQLIPDAVIKGKPYISAFEQGIDGSYFFSTLIDHVDSIQASSLTKTDQFGNVITSFASIETNGLILSIHELPDGKILIGGGFREINGVNVGPLLRLNADGTIDETFTRWPAIPAYQHLSRFVVQSDGKIVAVGSFSDYLGSKYGNIVRLNQNGTVDETFALNVTDLPFVPFIEVDENDNLAVSSGMKLYKLTADGAIHPDFSPLEVGGTGHFSNLKFFKDGEILVGGTFNSFAGVPTNNLVRIASDGTVDPTFTAGEFINYIWDLDVKDDRTFIVATNDGIKIFDDAGNPIHIEGLSAYAIEEVFLDNSQNVLVYGGFHQINGMAKPYLARLTTQFDFDETFSSFFSYTTDIRIITVQRDGKILVSGEFYGINDTRGKFLRLNADGSTDGSFVVESDFPTLTSLALRDDGKVLVTTVNSIKLLTQNGEIDNTFHEAIFNGETSLRLNSLRVHMNKIYVCGAFASIDGHNSNAIVRLNMDGTVDKTFQSNLPSSTYINCFNFQSENQIIVAGDIPFPGGKKSLIRLSDIGFVDGSFSASNHTSNSIDNIVVDDKDKIYVAGTFMDLNEQPARGLAKFAADGLVDNAFQFPGSILGNPPFTAMHIISDNRIVLGSSSHEVGLIVIDSTGQLIQAEYGSGKTRSTLVTSFFDDKTLFLGGRILTEDFGTVSGIAYVSFSKVNGGIEALEASRVSSTKIQLTWKNDFSNADAIIVERSGNDDASYSEIQSLPSSATQYEDADVSGGNVYYYRLRAVNSGSQSAYSDETMAGEFVVGVEEISARLMVYPNPTNGLLYIAGQNHFPVSVTILNALGKEMTTAEVINDTIDVRALAPAMYVLIFNGGNHRSRQIRFIKK